MQSIRNFVQLTELIGTAGQPAPEQLELIKQAGYASVINLALPDHADAIPTEGALVAGLGLNYIHLPVPFHRPLPGHVLRFCKLLQALEGTPVFVHCIMNYRVSAFMFHYLHTLSGWSVEAARSPIFERWTPDPVWSDLLAWSAAQIGLELNDNVESSHHSGH